MKFQRQLIIHNRDHFDAVLDFEGKHMSEKNYRSGKNLWSKIQWLLIGHYSEAAELHIFPDNIENSFCFTLKTGDDVIMSGGIICHGQPNVLTFTVDISPSEGIYFGVHT